MLVGREQEKGDLGDLLGSLLLGRGGVAVLVGEAGIGKSALLASLAVDAAARGIDVRSVAADPFDALRPLSLAVPLVRTELGPKAPDRWAAREPHELSADVLSSRVGEIIAALERLARSGPLLVMVDDVQWADTHSGALLVELGEASRTIPLALVVATRRDLAGGAVADVVVAGLQGAGTVHEVGPLDDEDVRLMCRARLGYEPAPAQLDVVAAAGGNPFVALELLDRTIGGAAPGPTERTIRHAVLAREDGLDGDTCELLRIASVLGTSFTVSQLAAASARRAATLLHPIAEAEAAGLLERRSGGGRSMFAFRHALVREVLYGELSPALRTNLHAQVAAELDRAGAVPSLVAAHLQLGSDPADSESASLFVRAAQQVLAESPEVSSELLKRALREIAAGPERDEADRALVHALELSGRAIQAAARSGMAGSSGSAATPGHS